MRKSQIKNVKKIQKQEFTLQVLALSENLSIQLLQKLISAPGWYLNLK